ncbi:MAG: glycosyltransferase [Xanthomonadales bacterium]|nr:glycosyltransferase [Xanthomonadales bacterium]
MNSSSGWRRRFHSRLRKLPFLPLLAALGLASVLARWLATFRPVAGVVPQDEPGISILIPERGTPELLSETLAAAVVAADAVAEPTQILVVVNGADESEYAALRSRWPQIEWLFHAQPLGYHGAIALGLRHVRHAWTYLLNSDMRLDPGALFELLGYRRSTVFAIASQIFLVDSSRRREETGWTDFNWRADRAEIYDRMPEPGELARGNLYAGGGSSLFRTALLRCFVRDSRDYAPFYWEDADWGISAWAAGREVLFCPKSWAWHHHRATISRHYSADEIKRVIERNALLFDVRRGWSGLFPRALIHRITESDATTRSELRGLGVAWRTFRSRLATRIAQRRGLRFDTLATHRYYSPDPDPTRSRPRVLMISPYAISPPVHGGARRVTELVERLAGSVDFFLLSDEQSLYSPASEKWLRHFRATYLVEGRGDSSDDQASLRQRLDRHAWPLLRDELKRLIELLSPDIVQVEFMELARLGENRAGSAKWILALHDVTLGSAQDDPEFDTLQRALMSRFDAITVCSNEDAALLDHPCVSIVANGATRPERNPRPSPDTASLLFMGPFRYPQNRDGILEFLSTAWPELKRQFVNLRLTILAGRLPDDGADLDPRLMQSGVELVTRFVEPRYFLDQCSMTINPLMEIRGSALKLIESLLAGRMCVSTEAGARGFSDSHLSGLVTANTIAGMAEPIGRLLVDTACRHSSETSDAERLDAYSWDTIAKTQFGLYQSLMRRQRRRDTDLAPISDAPFGITRI